MKTYPTSARRTDLAIAVTAAALGGFQLLGQCFASAAGAEFDRPWVRHTIDDSSRGADGVRLGDVNGDGLPDIVTGWKEGAEFGFMFIPERTRPSSAGPP